MSFLKKFKINPTLNNVGIRKKFFLVYFFCILLPIFASSFIWSRFTSKEIHEKETHILNTTAERVFRDIRSLTDNIYAIGNQIAADRMLFLDLQEDYNGMYEYYPHYFKEFRNRFDMYMVSNSDIVSMTLYLDSPNFISSNYFRAIDDNVKQTQWYQDLSKSDVLHSIFLHPTSASIVANRENITLIRKIRRFEFRNNIANYLHIEIKLDRVVSMITQEAGEMIIYVLDDYDRVIWASDGEKWNKDGTHRVFIMPDEKDYHISVQRASGTPNSVGWKVVGVYDKTLIVKEEVRVMSYIIGITLLFAVLSVIMITMILDSMRFRILLLSKHIEKVTDKTFTPLLYDNPGKDEIGRLIIFYNEMIQQINRLINDVYKLQVQKKDMELENVRAELKYLQSQVDPHFLFNTLNAIYVFCVKYQYEELSEVIANLSKLLKRLLVTGDDMVSVELEFDFIKRYLTIEKFRFGDKFSYEIQIESGIDLDALIPKMSIQPLVENACKHGLQAIGDNRRLLVQATKQPEGLFISIKDNGIGMSQERLDEIMEFLKSNELKEGSTLKMGVGLVNVYRRLKLIYGEKFTMQIVSTLGQGSEIILSIPLSDSFMTR